MPTQDINEADRREDEIGRNPATPPTAVGQTGGVPVGVVGDPNMTRPADPTPTVKDMDPAEAEWEKRINRPIDQAGADRRPDDADPSA